MRARHLVPAILLATPLAALAHSTGTSFVEVLAEPGEAELALAFHADELDVLVPLDADEDGVVDQDDVEARTGAIAAATLDRVGVSVPAGTCVPGPARAELDVAGGVRIATRLSCPGDAPARLDLALGHLPLLAPGHKVLGRARVLGLEQEFVADAATPAVTLRAGDRSFLAFLLLGVEHIFTGFDHLLFLAGLLLVVRSWRDAVAVVTSFTVAHSLTLGLATAGLVDLPGSIVEPLIAASVIWVGAENLLRPSPKGRTFLTFGFGLVHGFGFAGLLRELGLGGGSFLVTLLGFNLGVELGQLAVVLAAAPVLFLLRRSPRYEKLVLPAGSALIGFFGAYWLVVRHAG